MLEPTEEITRRYSGSLAEPAGTPSISSSADPLIPSPRVQRNTSSASRAGTSTSDSITVWSSKAL